MICSLLPSAQVGVVDGPEPPPPAPGSHNSEKFPELDVQRVPTDMQERVDNLFKACGGGGGLTGTETETEGT